MFDKNNLRHLALRLPLIGRLTRSLLLYKQHPVEWLLLHRCHHTSNQHASILHFSVNKAATQHVRKMLRRIGAENGMTSVHLHGYAFDADMPFFDHLNASEMERYAYLFLPQGYIYSNFGGVIEGIPALEAYRTVLIVRDPRDVLTSMYYSSAYSHPLPAESSNKRGQFLARRAHTREITVDQFVLENAEHERALYQRYTDFLVRKYPHIYLTRYEEMIADFDVWFNGLMEYCQLEVSSALRQALYDEAAKARPAQENVHAHVRKGISGDYLNKLQPETVAKLNEIFVQVLMDYDYI